jgi:hypothetical protein
MDLNCLRIPPRIWKWRKRGLKCYGDIMKTAEAERWARRLSARVQRVLADHPEVDADNVRHTLILLEQPPLERLQRSLIRGRAAAILRK